MKVDIQIDWNHLRFIHAKFSVSFFNFDLAHGLRFARAHENCFEICDELRQLSRFKT